MLKIRYRLVYNYNNYLNKLGLAPVALELKQGTKKLYISSNVLITPNQWQNGKIVRHDNADKITAYLYKWKAQIEEIELDALYKGTQMTLFQVKDAVKIGVHASASLREFVEAVIDGDSSRCINTKRSYHYLVNDIEKKFGLLTIADITYDIVLRYREYMRRNNLSENTIKGRLKELRCLLELAKLRKLIPDNPFDNIKIGNIGARVGYLTYKEVLKLENLELVGKEEKIRDLFLFSCYTGLRFSDLSTLEEAEYKNGLLIKKMKKTKHYVTLPINKLFWGKGDIIWRKYPNIIKLSHCASNTTFNKVLKKLGNQAKIKRKLYCHLGRKTFSNMLSELGMDTGDITILMGHRESRTTKTHYLFNDDKKVTKSISRLFR